MSLITLHSPLYLASCNPGKLREFCDAASTRGIPVKPLPGIESLPAYLEDGRTFEENARKKALHYSAYVSGPVFADDSGISVDALGGAPGVFSARFSGPNATDDENNRKLLQELRRVETAAPGFSPASLAAALAERGIASRVENQPDRPAAHYVCVIALAERDRILCVTEGRADGVILDEPRGTGGFGYDPYFFYTPLGKTFAELKAEEKFAVSHRGKAFRKLLESLSQEPRLLIFNPSGFRRTHGFSCYIESLSGAINWEQLRMAEARALVTGFPKDAAQAGVR
jgi:XTP/dITP diphosphohydrolase